MSEKCGKISLQCYPFLDVFYSVCCMFLLFVILCVCVRWTPFRYVLILNHSGNQKLQREGEKAKKDKKKETKREKKEKDKARESGEVGKEKHGHKKRHKDERHQEGKKERDHDKKRKLETENLEKSNLTEEHGQPVGSQNSSDSTLNSNKRHKPCLPTESCHNSSECLLVPSLRGEGCFLVGFVCFT